MAVVKSNLWYQKINQSKTTKYYGLNWSLNTLDKIFESAQRVIIENNLIYTLTTFNDDNLHVSNDYHYPFLYNGHLWTLYVSMIDFECSWELPHRMVWFRLPNANYMYDRIGNIGVDKKNRLKQVHMYELNKIISFMNVQLNVQQENIEIHYYSKQCRTVIKGTVQDSNCLMTYIFIFTWTSPLD